MQFYSGIGNGGPAAPATGLVGGLVGPVAANIGEFRNLQVGFFCFNSMHHVSSKCINRELVY